MRPITFAKQHGIAFTARYVKSDNYGRQHYKAILRNKATGKCISIDYSPSPLHNPASHTEERKQAIEAALTWIAHCAESLYWHERDEARANKYSAWLPVKVRIPYGSTEQQEYCRDAREYRRWLANAEAWSDLVNGIIDTDF